MILISFCTIIIILVLLSTVSINGYKIIYRGREYKLDINTWGIILFEFILIITSSIRYGFIDTYAYRIMYRLSKENLEYVYSAPWGVESSWLYLFYLLNKISTDPKLMQLVVSSVIISAFVYIIRKYSADTALSLWIFFCLVYMGTNNGIRQYFAMAITLWAFPLIIKKKYITYILITFIASQIHTSALICLLIPLIATGTYMNIRVKSLIVICMCFMFFPKIVNQWFSFIFGESKYVDYFSSTKAGMSILRAIVTAGVPQILAKCYVSNSKKIGIKLSKEKSLLLNILILDVVFTIMGIYMQYWARVGAYFSFASICLIPIMIREVFTKNNQKFLKILVIILYFIFFTYNIYTYFISGDLNSFRLDI